MSAKKYEVGQTVLLSSSYGRGNGPHEVPVVRVGRSLVYVESNGREVAFHIETGAERRGPNSTGAAAHIYTHGEWAERERRASVIQALNELGFTSNGYGGFKQSTETLERLLSILNEGPDQ